MAFHGIREDEEQREVSKRETLIRLYRYLLAYPKQLIIVCLIMAITIGITMISPLLLERAVDVHVANKDVKGLIQLGIVAIALFCIYGIGTYIRMMIMARVSNDILLNIREELFTHIQTLSFHFFDSRPTGKILARIIGDVNSLKDVLGDSVTKLIPDFITVVGIAIIMLIKNVNLALSAFLTLPLLMIGLFFIQIKAHKLWQIFRKKSSNLNAFVHENLSGIRIVQSFAAEEERRKEFYHMAEEQRDSFIHAVKFADGFGPVVEITWGLGGFLLYFIGISVLGVGTVGIGTFLAFSTYLTMFWSPIRNLANFYNKLVTNISAAERVFEILDTKATIVDQDNAQSLPSIRGDVTFDHVSFAYEDTKDTYILHDVNFHVTAGETIAFVGPTGAGKTTIVNLISRFYEATKGTIRIDEYPLQSVSIQSLRKQMGIMTQDNFLFSGTIKDNIRYGRLEATDEEIIEAAKAVHAHDFIMKLEKGYDTEISERGSQLSIGQRQLLAFARTMVSDPRILILDEATSNIDTHTELLVQQGIERLLEGRTSFVIAHRLSTIRKADRIFVIDKGTIVEMGNHEELMKKQGAYYQLYESQFH